MDAKVPCEGVEMLRWLFKLRNRLLTCSITRSINDQFQVTLLQHSDVTRATVETFADSKSALQRHAAIAEGLRAAGWSIASYTH